jgi:hypothetical protein
MGMPIYSDLPFLIVEEVEEPLNESVKPLKEGIGLSTTGKLFLAGLAAWIVGRSSKLKIRGTKSEIRAVAEALRSSRRFQEELKKPGASVKSVMAKLNVKNIKGKQFQRVLGVPWPL